MTKTLLAIALVLVAAAPATAKRAPTKGENTAIRSIVAGYVHQIGSPAAKDSKITSITVSSVDSRYADVKLDSKSAGFGEIVLHKSMSTWWVIVLGSSLGCDTAPKSVMVDLKIGCTPPAGVAWIDNCGPLVSKPSELVLACADGNYYFTGLKWREWGKASATVTGTAHANDCTPNCAAGHFHTYPVMLVADKLETCGSAKYYARLTVSYMSMHPSSTPTHESYTMAC